jgi:exodeoxyribonuclease-3
VWSHKQLLNVVSHTPVECDLLARLQAASDWIDIGRKFFPAPERLYTWWSYRARDWAESDRGRRLDHMWMTPDLADKAVGHRVVEPIRGWTRPSDHVPLITEFAF